ncbi:hypothetical protein Bbelb_143640 [Branchiostoma belcheri]|nr:hypothetical protein Bbelb_143640 [Branchiostoma belcheri]
MGLLVADLGTAAELSGKTDVRGGRENRCAGWQGKQMCGVAGKTDVRGGRENRCAGWRHRLPAIAELWGAKPSVTTSQIRRFTAHYLEPCVSRENADVVRPEATQIAMRETDSKPPLEVAWDRGAFNAIWSVQMGPLEAGFGRASPPLAGPRRHSAEIRWEGGTSKQIVIWRSQCEDGHNPINCHALPAAESSCKPSRNRRRPQPRARGHGTPFAVHSRKAASVGARRGITKSPASAATLTGPWHALCRAFSQGRVGRSAGHYEIASERSHAQGAVARPLPCILARPRR